MIIFSSDPEPFRTENCIEMYGEIDTLPTTPNITFILHADNFTEKKANEWLPIISHRLVIITDKYPKLSKNHDERIAIHPSLKKNNDNYSRKIEWLFGWTDRRRVLHQIANVPIPLIFSFLKENNKDIRLHRLVAATNLVLDDKKTKAILSYGVEPTNGKMNWPKRKKKVDKTPKPFRSDDLYWDLIIQNQPAVANQVRAVNKDIPTVIKKRKERVHRWV